ncbi:Mariner Mos1 transposase [Eumeta japonica]|uniref:Mariner Mos1 transposase n=1 Tax=Eumeta variegata TaxID=151549 RepID=A0A4C1UZ16_EUMVA|nr:Mariner Mos1 transposase [Eumeta japonica]
MSISWWSVTDGVFLFLQDILTFVMFYGGSDYILKHIFGHKATAEAHRILAETYGDNALSDTTCRDWFPHFKNNDFELENKEPSGGPKKFEDEKLEELLDQEQCQTLTELGKTLQEDESTISKHLKVLGTIQMQGHCVPYELKPRDIERCFLTRELLLQWQKRKGLLQCIMTGDEKWIHYDNPKDRKSWGKRGHASTSSAKQNIHGSKLLLCTW